MRYDNMNNISEKTSDEEEFEKSIIFSVKENSKRIKELNRRIKKLESPNIVTVISVIVMVASASISLLVAIDFFVEDPTIQCYENINRHSNTTEEAYRIWLYNAGDVAAEDITVKIDFPFQNTTIVELFKHSEELIVEGSEYGGIGTYEYKVKYSRLLVGEDATLTIIVDIENFDTTGDEKLWPDSKVWIGEEPPIEIHRIEGQFYH